MTDAATAEHEAVARAIENSGLTVAEVADRAGLDPVDLDGFPMHRVPLAVLSRLADVVGLPLGRLVNRWQHDDPEDPGDSAVVGAYLAEFRDGLTRDELAEALHWSLLRVERALATLDEALGGGEDYELVFTATNAGHVAATFAEAGLRQPLGIGYCTADASERTLAGKPLPPSGWQHDFR